MKRNIKIEAKNVNNKGLVYFTDFPHPDNFEDLDYSVGGVFYTKIDSNTYRQQTHQKLFVPYHSISKVEFL